jgi:hypothetical protein
LERRGEYLGAARDWDEPQCLLMYSGGRRSGSGSLDAITPARTATSHAQRDASLRRLEKLGRH